jgi:hypothetical protein
MNSFLLKLTVLALLFLTNVNTSYATVNFVGVRSCGEWFSNKRSPLLKAAQEDWLLGYLSGLASVTAKDFITGTDNASIFLWTDNFCKSNPLSGVDDAGNKLATELIRIKKL